MELSFDTPTMAELFFKQGQPERAAAIYRKLVKQHPDDAAARQRLSQIEASLPQQGDRMTFREHMQKIVESTPGAIASVIMGFDGIAIDTFQVGGADVDVATLMIEYAAAAKQLKASDNPAHGGLAELNVVGARLTAILRPLTPDYFIAVILGPEALSGKARYLLRIAAPHIAKELS